MGVRPKRVFYAFWKGGRRGEWGGGGGQRQFLILCAKKSVLERGGLPKLRSCQKWRTSCGRLENELITRSKRPTRLAQALNLSVAPAVVRRFCCANFDTLVGKNLQARRSPKL